MCVFSFDAEVIVGCDFQLEFKQSINDVISRSTAFNIHKCANNDVANVCFEHLIAVQCGVLMDICKC